VTTQVARNSLAPGGWLCVVVFIGGGAGVWLPTLGQPRVALAGGDANVFFHHAVAGVRALLFLQCSRATAWAACVPHRGTRRLHLLHRGFHLGRQRGVPLPQTDRVSLRPLHLFAKQLCAKKARGFALFDTHAHACPPLARTTVRGHARLVRPSHSLVL
jgi:hypothetical protein